MGGFQCQSVSVSKQCHARCSGIHCRSVPGETIGNCAKPWTRLFARMGATQCKPSLCDVKVATGFFI